MLKWGIGRPPEDIGEEMPMALKPVMPLKAAPRRRWLRLAAYVFAAGLLLALLLVAASAAFGTTYLALHPGSVPTFDWHLTVTEHHSLAIHYGPVCVTLPSVGAGACADYQPELNEISVVLETATKRQVVLALLVSVS